MFLLRRTPTFFEVMFVHLKFKTGLLPDQAIAWNNVDILSLTGSGSLIWDQFQKDC